MNQFFFQMVNIRENVSWVHDRQAAATRESQGPRPGRGPPRRFPQGPGAEEGPRQRRRARGRGRHRRHPRGADLANAGKHVYLVEREPTIGGHMAMFDKTFPTLDCAACILTPKMSAVKIPSQHHPLDLLRGGQVEGYVGNFKIKVKRKPRYIKEDLCVGCLECVDGLHLQGRPFPGRVQPGPEQAEARLHPLPPGDAPGRPLRPRDVPSAQDRESASRRCVEACDRECIDFTQTEEFEDIEVGTIILATGFPGLRPGQDARITATGSTRTCTPRWRSSGSSTPPAPPAARSSCGTAGHPKAVGIIHCVGSRDEKTNRWCSRVCCMYSLKLAHLVKEHTGAEDLQLLHRHADARGRATRSSTTSCSRKASTSSAGAWPR